MATKTKDPLAAIKRAVDVAKELATEDLSMVLSRLRDGEPVMGLVKMSYVEKCASELDKDDRDHLVLKLEKLETERMAAETPKA